MSIVLPLSPLPLQAVPSFLDYGRTLTPSGGGAIQRLNRLGDRFQIDVTMPRMRPGDTARIFLSKLRQAKREGAIFAFPQPGVGIGTPGPIVVDGAGQAGSAIALQGGAPGYTILDGQFFSIFHGGRRFLHHATADTTFNGAGKAAVPIFPMLRIRPVDGALCAFSPALIEGVLAGDAVRWTLAAARADGITFTITEAE